MKRLAPLLLVLALAPQAPARELPRLYQGVRPLGMGGAFTAVADDENALFYNPAGLDKIEKWGMGIVNPLVEINEEGVDFYGDLRDTDLDSETEVAQLLRDNIGDYLHARAALFPNYVRKHFGVGVLGQATVNAQPNNLAFPEIDTRGFGSLSGHAGLGFGFFEGVLRLGATAKYIHGERLEQVYTSADIAADDFEDQVEDDLQNGEGFGLDVGAMLEFPVPLKPTLAVTVQNVGDVDLGDAGKIKQQVNLGAAVSHSFSWVALTGAADWVDVTEEIGTDDDVPKRLHFGLEAKLWEWLALRCGLYQGYGTFGASLDFAALRIDYANYAEEIGSYAGQRSDRRHSFQLTLGW